MRVITPIPRHYEIARDVNDDEPPHIEELRRELVNRLDIYPMEDWSAPLLRAVIDTIDLAFDGIPMPPQPGPPRLRLIR